MDLSVLRRWWPLVAVVGLLGVAALAATRSTPQLERIPPKDEDVLPSFVSPPPEQSGAASPPSGTAPVSDGLPDWAGTVVLVLLGIVAVVLLVVVGWAVARDLLRRRVGRTVRRGSPDDAAAPTADDLVAAVDAGLLELSDADLDPRRAVIACWVRLEQAAAAAGTPRHPGDTPTDLVARLLTEQRVDASVLAAFAEVYREARYATHTVDDRMRTAARGALQRLRADLAGTDRSSPVGSGPVGGGPVGGGADRAGVDRPRASR